MKETGNEIEIYFDDLQEDAQKKFLKAMEIETSDKGNYDIVPIAIVPIPEIDDGKILNDTLNKELTDEQIKAVRDWALPKIEMSKDVEFPKWKGYENLEGAKQLVSYGCYNDNGQILEYAAKMTLERTYFKDLLLFIQSRIQKHIEEGKGLGLGIDSSSEIFEGLIIVPAEEVSFPDENIDEHIGAHEQFIQDMKKAGIKYEDDYHGRYFYNGTAVRTDEKGFPTRQDVIRATKVKLQWDNLGRDDYIVYPVKER